MKRFSLLVTLAPLALILLPSLALLTGCGGGAEEAAPVAQAPAPTSSRGGPAAMAPSDSGDKAGEDSGAYASEGVGGSSYGSDQGGMGAGGGMAMGGGGMGMGMGGMGMGGGGMGGMGGMGGGKAMGPPGMDGEESSMMGSGYPTGGMENQGESSGMGDPYDMRSMAANSGGSKGGGMGMGMPAGYGDMMDGSGMGEGGAMGGFASGGFGNAGSSGINQFVSQNCISCHGNLAPKGGVSLSSLSGDFAADVSVWEQVIEQVEADAMPPANAQRRPNAQQQQAFVELVKAELTKAGVGEGQDFLARAKSAFARGKESEAIDFVYAQALTAVDEDAESILKNARWFAAGKRPVTTLRFAVGIVLEAPAGLDVKPIGVSQLGGGAGGGASRPSMGGYGEGQGGGAGNEERERSFHELTGDFGQALASAFETRWTSGALGAVFSDVVPATPAPKNASGGMGMMGMGMGMGEEGRGMSMGPPGMGGGFGGEGGGSTTSQKTVVAGQSITPGLLYLGTGNQKELQKKAADQGIDGLFLFDIEATSIRNSGIVTNTTKLRLLLTTGTIIASTKSLKNIEVEKAKMAGKDGDEVDKNVAQLFNKFDSELKLIDMPTPKPEHAKGRLMQLVNDKSADKLQTLFETRLYHSLGALTQEEAATVYQIVLRGNEGIALASGTPADRKLVMQEVLNN